jgi:tetratricopeptide (TPR) repeat protein
VLAPDDLNIQRVATRLLKQDPDHGPAAALKFLDANVISKFGDTPVLRIDKADLLIAINDDELPQQLAALTEGIDDWSTQNKIQLWYAMASKYFQIGMREDAMRGWTKVTELSPNDLPTRLMLFSLAHDAGDDTSMQAAQKRILEVVDRNDPTYLYTEARRRLTLLRKGELAIEDLPAVVDLVTEASADRPDWDRLLLLRAEIAMIGGDEESALKHYQRASQMGRSPVGAIIQHVRLLVARGRFEDAKLVVDRLPESTRQQAIGQLYAEILFNNNEVPAAIKSAQLVLDQAPDNANKQLWYGQLMAKIAQSDSLDAEQQEAADTKAGDAFRRSVDLDPSLQEAWLALISYHMYHQDRPNAEQALREAQLGLSSERLPLMVAKCYEVMGRAFDAENLYRSAWESNPDNLFAARQLAVFYLRRSCWPIQVITKTCSKLKSCWPRIRKKARFR